jgi:hypothetical protein
LKPFWPEEAVSTRGGYSENIVKHLLHACASILNLTGLKRQSSQGVDIVKISSSILCKLVQAFLTLLA